MLLALSWVLVCLQLELLEMDLVCVSLADAVPLSGGVLGAGVMVIMIFPFLFQILYPCEGLT